jgi:hypothetical protein
LHGERRGGLAHAEDRDHHREDHEGHPDPEDAEPRPLEDERARQPRERQQDRVAADQAWALVGVDRRRGAQLISIIFSRTA